MTIIATRTLSTKLGPMSIEMDAPVQLGADFACVYRIRGPRTAKRGRAMGVDRFQALQLAMERIGADLRASPEFEAGALEWLGMAEPGFPLPESIVHLGWAKANGH